MKARLLPLIILLLGVISAGGRQIHHVDEKREKTADKVEERFRILSSQDSSKTTISFSYHSDGTHANELNLIDKDGSTIKTINWKEIHPYMQGYSFSTDAGTEGLLYLGEEINKFKIRALLPESTFNEIPDDYIFNYGKVGPPVITTNGNGLFAASFVFEWGKSLLAEHSIGEFQTSAVIIWDEQGKEINRLYFDFGVSPYFTNSGKYLWFQHGQRINVSLGGEPQFNSCMRLFDIESNKEVFTKCFEGEDLVVGGYSTSSGFFSMTSSIGHSEYTIFYFDDQAEVLYHRTFHPIENPLSVEELQQIDIEQDYQKINLKS